MKQFEVLNIFYEEPDPDRWFPFDRYPRKLIRRIVRGKQRPGGQMMVALELMRGLDKIGIPYRFNDFKYADQHSEELVCLIGKPHLLFERKWKNPIVFGASVFSYPIDCPDLFQKYPNVQRVLVPGEWMRKMFEPYYGNRVLSWPVGIDTEKWSPITKSTVLDIDFLIYDKIRWEHEFYHKTLIQPLITKLQEQGLTYDLIKYGNYSHSDLTYKLSKAKAVIFLCEHETQGLAYQQILSTNTPILSWDRQGYWQDPSYYPEKVKYEAVSAVPYWDERCGLKFKDLAEFSYNLEIFLMALKSQKFSPRNYILENLTLEKCAMEYYQITLSCNG